MRAWTLGLLSALLPNLAFAQDCDCDHELQPGALTVNGDELGVQPGDRICVQAGAYEFIRFESIQGTDAEPVVITNCGGQVRIHNEDRAYGLVVGESSQHFRLLGTGDPAHEYGFRVSVPATDPWPGVGLSLVGRSTNYEVSHIEIHDTGFAGVSAKTDPLCDGSADQDVFVQRDVEIHHLYVHDTGGEGFYVGSTQSDGQTINCDGVDEVHQPHYLEGIHLHHNLIERTAWDGMQVGMARSDCAVYANTIVDVGLAGVEYQQQGLQVGTYSSCEVYGNVIQDGPAMGIIVLGAGPTRIYNNLIVDFGGDGIYANHRDVGVPATYDFVFNTIVGYGESGIRVFGPQLGPSAARSNLVVGAAPQITAGGDVSFSDENNVVVASVSEAGFVGAEDYHLADDSPARGAGAVVDGIGFDLEGRQRADPPSAGAYEHVSDSPGEGGAPGEPPPPPRGGGGGSASEPGGGSDEADAGCGCRAAAGGVPRLATLWVALLGAGVFARRRRLRCTIWQSLPLRRLQTHLSNWTT